jgi:hypothetical protein
MIAHQRDDVANFAFDIAMGLVSPWTLMRLVCYAALLPLARRPASAQAAFFVRVLEGRPHPGSFRRRFLERSQTVSID